jgi:diguanylate cyclase (GGDEF)-like protein/hemerythrin-like metal-binding protein
MIDVNPVQISWLTLALAGVVLSFLGVLLGFFLAGRLKQPHQEHSDTYRLRVETQKRLLDSAERANQGLQHAMEILEWAAGTDRLTGAWNRRRFEEAATAEIALVRRRKGPVSLMMLDLDFFKNVNDTHGHNVGDAVLVEIVYIAREQLRASDALVRWGGEEFIVLSPATRMDGAMNLAEKIRDAVAAKKFPEAGQVTVSIGVAEYTLGEDLNSWIQRADDALYRAKAGGRNQVVMAENGGEAETWVPPLIEIVWEDSYACGQPIIDSQHRKLFTLANSLIGAISSGQPTSEATMRLRRLMAHTAQHFHDEEAILARVDFPGHSTHAAEHQRLLEKASRFEAEVGSGMTDLSQFVGFLILDLVQGHILTEDKSYFGYFQPPAAPNTSVPLDPQGDRARIW